MPHQETVVILPCTHLEDLPTWRTGKDAEELLTAWTVGWHPLLLARAGKLPVWKPNDVSPEELQGCLVLLPRVSVEEAPGGWRERCEADMLEGLVLENLASRQQVLARALDGGTARSAGNARRGASSHAGDDSSEPSARPAQDLIDEMAPEFFALSLASLIVELLGHSMHYSSNIDYEALAETAVAAAQHTCEGRRAEAEEKLQRSFDLLGQARDYYYPVESYFLDVTLLAPSVWGDPLVGRLNANAPTNILLPAAQLEKMAESSADSVDRIAAAIAEEKASLVGGDYHEADLAQMPLESVLKALVEGEAVYRKHLKQAPEVFGRFSGGWSPLLPCLLDGLGYRAALLSAFDGSPLPSGDQCRFRWEGMDGTSIDALGITPSDVGDAGSMLRLADQLGHSMQRDHVATVLFASWPGHQCEFYDDLRRASRRCPTLGRFVTLGTYLHETHGGDMPAMFSADRFPPLPLGQSGHGAAASYRARRDAKRQELLDGLARVVASGQDEPTGSSARGPAGVEANLERIAEVACDISSPGRANQTDAVLIVHVGSLAQTICFASSPNEREGGELNVPPDQFAAEVPALGFVWQPARAREEPPVPLAEGTTLRNEHFEVHINRDTGGIGAVHDYRRRRNRLSQQVGFRLNGQSRLVGDAETAVYTQMVAEEIRVTAATAACGEISSRGRLVDGRGETLAQYRQITRLKRASRLIEIEVELSSLDPSWRGNEAAYAATRWAWRDAPLEVLKDVNGASFVTSKKRVRPGSFIDVRESDGRLVIFGEGIAEHRRPQENRLDSVVPLAEQDPIRYMVAVGIDVDGGAGLWEADWDLAPLVTAAPPVAEPRRAWWFLCPSRSVKWTHLAPLDDGRAGFSARLQEVTGRYVRTSIESFRPIRSARRTNFRGEPQIELPVREGRVELQMAGYQWVQIEAEW